MNIKELNITSVEINEEFSGKNDLFINFCLDNEKHYYLTCIKENGKWIPMDIHHLEDKNYSNKNGVCSFCPKSIKEEWSCDGLEKFIKELYEFLTHHPQLRLRLLFR